MTYDGTDANDDGVVEANVNNESVDTEQAHIDSDPSVKVWKDGSEFVAIGADGEIARDADATPVIEAADGDGEHIALAPNTTHLLQSLPLQLNGNNLTLSGPRSAIIKVDDNLIDDNTGPVEVSIGGTDTLFHGFTFDGNVQNQGADDTYGFFLQNTAEDNTFQNIWSKNAVGDAFNCQNGTTVINCKATGFTEDGIELGASGATVIGGYYEGVDPLKVSSLSATVGDLTCIGVEFVGDGSPAANLMSDSANDMENLTFTDCTFRTLQPSTYNCIKQGGDGTIRDVDMFGCTFRDGKQAIRGGSSRVMEQWTISGGVWKDLTSGGGVASSDFRNCTFKDISIRNVSTLVIDLLGSAVDNKFDNVVPSISEIGDSSGDKTKVNGLARESANADSPQESYSAGTIVSFDDTGDDSADGIFVVDEFGNPQGPL